MLYTCFYMRGMRQRKPGGGSLVKTVGTAMIIAGLISFAAMFFPLQKAFPQGGDALSYYLPWCLAYGIVSVMMAGYGMAALLYSEEQKRRFNFASCVIGIVSGGLLIAESLPIVIVLREVEFFICLALIGVCLIVIAVMGVLSYKEASE